MGEITMKCPVCKQELKADERLILRWFEKCKWWVIEHGTAEDSMAICGHADAARHYPDLFTNPTREDP